MPQEGWSACDAIKRAALADKRAAARSRGARRLVRARHGRSSVMAGEWCRASRASSPASTAQLILPPHGARMATCPQFRVVHMRFSPNSIRQHRSREALVAKTWHPDAAFARANHIPY